MKTSVVITTYNGKKFIIPLLDSLKNQTRKIDEVLIFDDKSDDNTQNIINKYIEDNQLTNWKLFVNDSNLGWEKNFTQALSTSSGDVIFPCDQDDIWHLDKIEKMTAAFEDNRNILLLVSGYHAFNEQGEEPIHQLKVQSVDNNIVSKVLFDKTYYQIRRPGCTMALSNKILPMFLENWKPGSPHDAVLWCIASLLDGLYLYKSTFIEFRRHDNNASNSISHGYKYKVNEVVRTKELNDWYIKSKYFDIAKQQVITDCNIWCNYRYKLLVNKKFLYWFKLLKYKDYYLTNKKYVGDLYYFLKRS